MLNFYVGKTWFHFRLLCAAHTCDIVVIAVATSMVGDAVFGFVCLFSFLPSAWFVELFFIKG